MALKVECQTLFTPRLENLSIRCVFRGNMTGTAPHAPLDGKIELAQSFEYMLGTPLSAYETISLELYTYSKVFGDKCVGNLVLLFQQLIEDGYVKFHKEVFITKENKISDYSLTAELFYVAPGIRPDQTEDAAASWNLLELVGQHRSTHEKELIFDNFSMASGKTKSLCSEDRGAMELAQRYYIEGTTDIDDNLLQIQPVEEEEEDDDEEDAASRAEAEERQKRELNSPIPRTVAVNVAVIEARDLPGMELNPVCMVTLGKGRRTTSPKTSTQSPYWNEYFNFEYTQPMKSVLHQTLIVKIIHVRSFKEFVKDVFTGSTNVVGEFKIQLRLVYKEKNHTFLEKWATLYDPKTLKEKGHIRLTLQVIPNNTELGAIFNKNVNRPISKNLLVPRRYPKTAEGMMLAIRILRCLFVPPWGRGFRARVSTLGSLLADPYIQLSYNGLEGRTEVKSNTCEPHWNEGIIFTDLFPSYCEEICIQLKDRVNTGDRVIATHYVNLRTIMSNTSRNGFFPTFGPAYVNLYGAPNGFPADALNLQTGQPVMFKGALFMSIQSLNEQTVHTVENKITKKFVPSAPEDTFGKVQMFYACVLVKNVFLLQKKYEKQKLHLRLEIAGQGYFQESTDELPLNCTTTTEMTPQTDDQVNYYLDVRRAPLLYVKFKWWDQRKRQKASNILRRLNAELEALRLVLEASIAGGTVTDDITKYYDSVITMMREVVAAHTYPIGAKIAGRSILDQKKGNLLKDHIGESQKDIVRFRSEKDAGQHRSHLKKVGEIADWLEPFVETQEHGLPDMFIWIFSGKQAVACYRFDAQDILYSTRDVERGKRCGTLQTVPISSPLAQLKKHTAFHYEGVIEMLPWLGIASQKSVLLETLPTGYTNTTTELLKSFKLHRPIVFNYTAELYFRLNAHLYSARQIPAEDDSGLSDPFCRISAHSLSVSSVHKDETLNPIWDQTISLPAIRLRRPYETLNIFPPEVFVELFDMDEENGKSWFFGPSKNEAPNEAILAYAVVQPMLELLPREEDKQEEKKGDIFNLFAGTKKDIQLKLDWINLYRGTIQTGQLLAAFEMKEVTLAEYESEYAEYERCRFHEAPIIALPPEIRPSLQTYRLDMVLWGLRDLKTEKPFVRVEVGDRIVESEVIHNFNKLPNFSENIVSVILTLPDERRFWPSIQLKFFSQRNFGTETLLGRQVIPSLEAFYVRGIPTDALRGGLSKMFGGLDKTELMRFSGLGQGSMATEAEDPMDLFNLDADVEGPKIDVAEKKDDDGESDEFDDEATPSPRLDRMTKISLDWWVRYYLSLHDVGSHNDDENALLEEDEEVGLTVGDGKKEKKKFGARDVLKQGLAMKQKLGEKATELKGNIEKDTLNVSKSVEEEDLISRIVVFPQELEKEADFHKFQDWMKTWPIMRGRDDLEIQTIGYFKGNFQMYDWDEDENYMEVIPKHVTRPIIQNLPDATSHKMLVRVYVVRALNLTAKDINGRSDPYVEVILGNKKQNTRRNYIPKSLNPTFGHQFQFEADFPAESRLTINVWDFDRVGSDDMIGQTMVDLEDRVHTKHRATCGIAAEYDFFGYNVWRDYILPTQIIDEMCDINGVLPPVYRVGTQEISVGDVTFHAETELESEQGTQKQTTEPLALEALRNWQKVKKDSKLVPEHVESRALYLPDKPGHEQGRIHMWVDIFPFDSANQPPPVDITPRKPVSYQLRVTVWNTQEVVLADRNFLTGEESSDIFLKSWIINPKDDMQKTDVHYRSLTGEGNFNWRWIWDIDYLSAENMITYKAKGSTFDIGDTEFKIPAILQCQVWDADRIGADNILGSYAFNLNKIPQGAKTYKACSAKMLDSNEHPTVNLFKQERMKGWWPMVSADKKSIGGKVELEWNLLTRDEADASPAGRGHEEPDPLDPPIRPETSFNMFLSPLKGLGVLWNTFKWMILKVFIVVLIAVLIGLFFYSTPGYVVKKILGA